MTTRRVLFLPALLATIALTGCAASGEDPLPADDAAPSASAPATGSDSDTGSDFDGGDVVWEDGAMDIIQAIGDCGAVEALVAPYIGGLVAREDNTVDEWGVMCGWEAAEDETDLANNRIVSVGVAPNEPDTQTPDTSGVAAMEGGSTLEASWLTARDGVASSLTLGTAVAGVTITDVWIPEVSVSIGGGTWDGYPSLDANAALALAQQLIG